MKTITAFCDLCGKQFPDNLQEFSQFVGAVIKLDAKMNAEQKRFSADYCDVCTKKILEFIEKQNAEHTNTEGMGEPPEPEPANSRT